MEKRIYAIRGAVCAQNTQEDIQDKVCLMCNEIFSKNKISSEDLVSIQFTITDEITVMNPATALRKGNMIIDVSKTALFCSQEARIENAMKNVIRVMITAYLPEKSEICNIYLNGAEKLRPDFSKNK